MGIKEIIEVQNVNLMEGLKELEIQSRLDEFGFNELKQDKKETLIQKFLEQLQEPMIVLLIISAIISLLMGQYEDAVSIICVRKNKF